MSENEIKVEQEQPVNEGAEQTSSETEAVSRPVEEPDRYITVSKLPRSKRSKPKGRALKMLLFTAMVTLISCCLTIMLIGSGIGGNLRVVNQEQYNMMKRYARLDEVYRILKKEYYIDPDTEAMTRGAISGMMASLGDPYTFYYTSEAMETQRAQSRGLYHGVGIVVNLAGDGYLHVSTVYGESSAERAGVQVGDTLLAVDGQSVAGNTMSDLEKAVELVQGEDGTEVELKLKRDGRELVVTCMRGEVQINYTEWRMLSNDIGYIVITGFQGNASEKLKEAILSLQAAHTKGIVLDLRDNPGGLLESVKSVSDQLLPGGLLTYIEDRAGNREEHTIDDVYWDIPMVVLVNGNTASASELFAAAVQDKQRGKVVGTTTFGKGIVQNVISFASDGAGMQYTVASYYSPNGNSIHKKGVTPDVIVEPSGESFDPKSVEPSKDNQLAAAIEELIGIIDEAA